MQVLTANYLPEYGRSSRRTGPLRDQERQQPLQRQWIVLLPRRVAAGQQLGPQPQHQPDRRAGPAPFDYKQYGYSFGGPILKNKLFFFGAQEWVNFFQVATNTVTVPTEAMRNGDFSELLNPNNGFYSGARGSSTIR